MKYGDGSFCFVTNASDRNLLMNAHWAITCCELWEWLETFEDESFTFSRSPHITTISKKMEEQPAGKLHSGYSFGCTMRNMEYIAKHGYDAYENEYLSRNRSQARQ